MDTCVIRQFGCSCEGECQDHWEVTKAKLFALDKDTKAKTREHDAWLRRVTIRASLVILVGLAVGLALVHADEKFRQQEIAERV